MLHSKLGSLLLASTMVLGAAGCASDSAAVENIDYGPVFDEDGRADSATVNTTNPGKILVQKFATCEAQVLGDTGADPDPETLDALNTCFAKANNATGWTIEWRNARIDSSFVAGAYVNGPLKTSRQQWAAYCGELREGHSSAYDSSPDDVFFLADCINVGERATATVAIERAYFYDGDDYLMFRREPNDDFTLGCDDTFNASMRASETTDDVNGAYRAFAACVQASVREYAATAEDFINQQNARYDLGDGSPSTALTALNAYFEAAHGVCESISIAGQYGSDVYGDDEPVVSTALCEIKLALFASERIAALQIDAGGTFDLDEN